ncbi:uncharacterized protein LOC142333622 isoform X2 [Lycorma delicatula]|uniref:uncharacterized protein LOC142333622 isoform X2 n=1 Tax=Lycorma delicatula TaxID=130591 RepID=UPI003F51A954
MISEKSPLLICFLLVGVLSMPNGGAGSFNAKADFGRTGHAFPNFFGRGTGTYAGNYGYGAYNAGNFGSKFGSLPLGSSGGYHGGFSQPGSSFGTGGFGSTGFENCGYGSGGYGSGGYGSGGYGSGFGGGGGGGSGSFPTYGYGTGAYSGPSGAFSSAGTGGGFPNYGFGGFSGNNPSFMPFDFNSLMKQHFAIQEDIMRKHAEIAQRHKGDVSSNDVGGVGAVASGQFGPQGGYGSANVYPAPEGGLEDRFGEADNRGQEIPASSGGPVGSASGSVPPPTGSFQGVSSFSSSSQTDVNGKKTSQKQSSVSFNDNGKVTTFTAHDP